MKYLFLLFINSCGGDNEKNLNKKITKENDRIQKDTFISNNETLIYV
jgi:hypothetical protein